MLSPNATNLVSAICGTFTTVTGNEHIAVRSWASRAVQLTTVVPTEKLEPLGGVHVVVTGAVPPDTSGGENATVTGVFPMVSCVGGLGQLIVGAAVDGCVGPPQAGCKRRLNDSAAAYAALLKADPNLAP